ncbi:Transcriptional regulatory protein sin3, partial [Tulasnella sp. 417]
MGMDLTASAPSLGPVPGPALVPQRASSTQPWPATALTPGSGGPAIPGQPNAESMPGAETLAPGTPGPALGDQSGASSLSGAYRPLNVKDALSYLEKIKIKFQERPGVYNQFLDIMKDFKSQTIDTPGVIDRVSTLLHGHPSLIQGFNTFLRQGYRIECSEGDDGANTVTVTTPTSIHTQTADGIIQRTRSFVATPVQTPGVAQPSRYFQPGPPGAPPPSGSPYPHGPPPGSGAPPAPFNDPVLPAAGTPMGPSLGLPPQQAPHSVSPRPIHLPHPTTPGIAAVLGGLQHPNGPPVITGPLAAAPRKQQFLPDTTATSLEGGMGTAGGFFDMIRQITTTQGGGHRSGYEGPAAAERTPKRKRQASQSHPPVPAASPPTRVPSPDGMPDPSKAKKPKYHHSDAAPRLPHYSASPAYATSPPQTATLWELNSSGIGKEYSMRYAMTLEDDIGPNIGSISPLPVKVNGHFCDLFEGIHTGIGRVALKRPRIDATGYNDAILR